MATSKHSADLVRGMQELLHEGQSVTWDYGADCGVYVLSIIRGGEDAHGYGNSMQEAWEDLRHWLGEI